MAGAKKRIPTLVPATVASAQVLIGCATRRGRELDNCFVLCREGWRPAFSEAADSPRRRRRPTRRQPASALSKPVRHAIACIVVASRKPGDIGAR